MTVDDLIRSIESSRAYFFRHVKGMTDEQGAWKPYPQCKSVNETLAHLRVDDLAAMDSFESGEEPKYEEISAPIMEAAGKLTRVELEENLRRSHEDLIAYIRTKFSQAPLDSEVCVWGSKMPLSLGIPHLSSEDFYHAGQVAYIRMAQDAAWDYYAAVYGGA